MAFEEEEAEGSEEELSPCSEKPSQEWSGGEMRCALLWCDAEGYYDFCRGDIPYQHPRVGGKPSLLICCASLLIVLVCISLDNKIVCRKSLNAKQSRSLNAYYAANLEVIQTNSFGGDGRLEKVTEGCQ
jgi:hypothetical protein